MKICIKCDRLQADDNFYLNKRDNRLSSSCKICWTNHVKSKYVKVLVRKEGTGKGKRTIVNRPPSKYSNLSPLEKRAYLTEYQNMLRAKKLNALPKWYEQEKDKIRKVYVEAARRNMTVDHIVPLKSDTVQGFHVWSNLQLLSLWVNTQKFNKYSTDV